MLGKWLRKLSKLRDGDSTERLSGSLQSNSGNIEDATLQNCLQRVQPSFLDAIYGNPRTEVRDITEKLIAQAIAQQVRDSEQRRSAVPRLPSIIPLLLRQLRDPDASARDYAAVIKQDPVVASAVLKIANSVYFNPYRKNIENFEQAVVALGIEGLRLVLSTAVLQPIVRGQNSKLPQKIWDHSLACAVCCQQLAERERLDGFKAYLMGLVHDIGVITLFNQLQLQSATHLAGQLPNSALLAQLVEQWAQPLAYWIAQDWQLPSEIVRALAAQYEPPSINENAFGRILRRANCIGEAYLLVRMGIMPREELQIIIATLKCPNDLQRQLDDAFTEASAQVR